MISHSKYAKEFWSILVGTQMMRGYMITPTGSTFISQVNHDGEDIGDTSRQLFWSILEHSRGQEVGEVVCLFKQKIQLFLKFKMMKIIQDNNI